MSQYTRRSAILASAAVPATLFTGSKVFGGESDQVINLPTRITKESIAHTERKPDATYKDLKVIVERLDILAGGLTTTIGVYVQQGERNDYHLRLYADVTGVGQKLKVAVSQMTGVLQLRSDHKTVLTIDLVLS